MGEEYGARIMELCRSYYQITPDGERDVVSETPAACSAPHLKLRQPWYFGGGGINRGSGWKEGRARTASQSELGQAMQSGLVNPWMLAWDAWRRRGGYMPVRVLVQGPPPTGPHPSSRPTATTSRAGEGARQRTALPPHPSNSNSIVAEEKFQSCRRPSSLPTSTLLR